MVRRYGIAILCILLSVGLLDVQGAIGFSKSSKAIAAHKKRHSSVKVMRAPRNLVLRSASALVMDQETGELLFQKQTEAVLPIASITKLMTAMVVLDAQIDLEESITIEPTDVVRYRPSRLPVGTHLSRENALLLTLMASENRAAHALGRTYPGGSEAFVIAMNAKAKSLGLSNTSFEDTSGLSSGNTSSAQDLAMMVDAAYQYSLVREFTTREDATIHSGRRTLEFHNTNRLIQNPRWQIGLSKTGFTNKAGRCLVMQASVAQRSLLIVLLDAQGKRTRFADANRIKKWMERQPLA
ncbi:MAG: D-alanyl-D-alanine endopeptidase [Desulfobacteraceae bacterium A6]|nr:MAG: D-alanyl-D-alanine endopeptidase [Desulfobacteraceae bacterium A6]